MSDENTVFELEPDDEVSCIFCRGGTFRRGEAYLAGAGHSPYNGNANYVCREHLDEDAVVYDTVDLRGASPDSRCLVNQVGHAH